MTRSVRDSPLLLNVDVLKRAAQSLALKSSSLVSATRMVGSHKAGVDVALRRAGSPLSGASAQGDVGRQAPNQGP